MCDSTPISCMPMCAGTWHPYIQHRRTQGIHSRELELEEDDNFLPPSNLNLYAPVPHIWIFVPNFAIHHGNSAVSPLISNSTAVHGPPSALHRTPILHTSGSWDEILEGGILLCPITLT